MGLSTAVDIDLESVADVVDPATFDRGLAYADSDRVIARTWAPSLLELSGVVKGRAPYTVTVRLAPDDIGGFTYVYGSCNCPMGHNCKHAVALAVSARPGGGREPGRWTKMDTSGGITLQELAPVLAAAAQARRGAPVKADPWREQLGSLLDGVRPGPGLRPAETPIAIELSIRPVVYVPSARYGGQRRAAAFRPGQPAELDARLVERGRNGGWIAGSVSWAGLDTMVYRGQYSPAQIEVLSELRSLYRAAADRSWSYGDDKRLALSKIRSASLWTLLDDARAAGIELIHARKRLGAVWLLPPRSATLDVTAGEAGGLVVSPMLTAGAGVGDPLAMAGAGDLVPVIFMGPSGHGVVCVDSETALAEPDPRDWPLWIARCDPAVPRGMQQMVLSGERPAIPPEAVTTFRAEYYPKLRAITDVVSSDGSFAPPRISGPELLLEVQHEPGHQTTASWAWEYQIDDEPVRVPPGEDAAFAYRDRAAESAIVLAVADSAAGMELFGARLLWHECPAADPAPARAPVPMRGLAVMRFATLVLPLLEKVPGVRVEETGQPADYREVTDLVRIEVSADEVATGNDWFDLGVSVSAAGRPVPFAEVFSALARGERYLLLDDGSYFSLDKPELRALASLIEEARALTDAPPGELRISRFQAGLWEELCAIGIVARQAASWQRQVGGLLELERIERAAPPAGLRAQLRPYQLDGYQWLAFLWRHRLGGILADDMGLGKTVQALALIAHAREGGEGGVASETGDGPEAGGAAAPFLIVAPTSVVPNWVAEAARFTPGLKVVSVGETQAKRGESIAALAAGADAIVTSYTLLRMDFDAYSAARWCGLILDEAQYVKNHQSKAYQSARKIAAPFKLAITGTPMENNLMELWSLLSITAPGLFPSPSRFAEFYAKPIERRAGGDLLPRLRSRIRPLIRRRLKEHVAAELPAKQEQVLTVDLHPRHRALYDRHLQRERQKVLGLLDDVNANRFTIFRSLTLLRQLSLHAGLVSDEHAGLASAKVDLLVGQLGEVVAGDHRALVFSQFTGFLAKVRERLDTEGIGYTYLDGRTRDRASVLERFRGGSDPVFLISLKAGGFGLNLTEADYCFLLDPWWNPATEAQAIDRTHRIGQTRNVMVYRLIARDTIEEKVMALKERKAELFASVMDSGDSFGGALGADDIRGLFA